MAKRIQNILHYVRMAQELLANVEISLRTGATVAKKDSKHTLRLLIIITKLVTAANFSGFPDVQENGILPRIKNIFTGVPAMPGVAATAPTVLP